MFWNKKDRVRGLPDLPPMNSGFGSDSDLMESNTLNNPVTHEEIPDEMHNEPPTSLPSFPDSPAQQGFSQAAIKDAVMHEDSSLDESELPSLPSLPSNAPEFPAVPSTPSQTYKPLQTIPLAPAENVMPWMNSIHIPAVSAPPPAPIPQFERAPVRRYTPSEDKPSDIFVRLDRFYTARKALETTKEKLSEIDEMLRKIRETKLREEQELNAWEKQLADVKNRMQDVVQNIFEKIE